MGWILAVYDQQIQHDTPLCGATDLYFSTYWMEKGAVVCFYHCFINHLYRLNNQFI